MKIKWILLLLVLFCAVIFTAQNYHAVEVQFIIWSFKTSKALIIFGCLILGIVIGWTMSVLGKKPQK